MRLILTAPYPKKLQQGATEGARVEERDINTQQVHTTTLSPRPTLHPFPPPFLSMRRPSTPPTLSPRSVYLVLMAGAATMVTYLVAVNESLLILWGADHSLEWFWSSLLLFFITPIVFVSYICRALRLAVVFHPKAKRTMPWLIPVSASSDCCFIITGNCAFVAQANWQFCCVDVYTT